MLAEVMLGSEKWTVLKPTEMKSSGGATLSKLDDDSILVSGTPAAQDSTSEHWPDGPQQD